MTTLNYGRSARAAVACVLSVTFGGAGRSPASPPPLELRVPAGDRFVEIDASGETVLPSGRVLTPRGRQITTAPHPFGMALSPDGEWLVTVNGGTEPFSLTLIEDPGGPSPRVRQIPTTPSCAR